MKVYLGAFGCNNTAGEIEIAGALLAKGGSGRMDFGSETFCVTGNITHSLTAEGFDASEDGPGRGSPLVPVAIPIALSGELNASFDVSGPLDAGSRSGGGQLAIAFNLRGREGGSQPEVTDVASLRSAPGGSSRSYIAHGETQEAGSREVLRELRDALGEEAFSEWGFGVLAALWPKEVLRSEVHGGRLRQETLCAIEQETLTGISARDLPRWSMQSLLSIIWQDRGTSPRPESIQQRAWEFGEALLPLSPKGTPQGSQMLALREASYGIGLLRDALSAVEAHWRSIEGVDAAAKNLLDLWSTSEREGSLRQALHAKQTRQASGGGGVETQWQVRRLSVCECAILQGFPPTYCHIKYGRPRKIEADEAAYLRSHGIECWADGDQWMTSVTADGNAYKALGNSMAVPCMHWLGERIEMADEQRKRANPEAA